MYKRVLQEGAEYLSQLSGHTFNVLEVKPPASSQAAINLANTISKLSPLVGNLIEFVFGIFLFLNGTWILIFESGGTIRALMMCIHAYFNIWCQAIAGMWLYMMFFFHSLTHSLI